MARLSEINIRASKSYQLWLDSFAAHRRTNRSALVDEALESHAAATGYATPPPRIEPAPRRDREVPETEKPRSR